LLWLALCFHFSVVLIASGSGGDGCVGDYGAGCFEKGRHDDAITGYHRALQLKPDDSFATEMLNKALHVSRSLD
ncbi:unnamed protein product, partial [Laminaria digitata]